MNNLLMSEAADNL